MPGVPLEYEAYLFGDSKSIVQSSTILHSQLAKRWNLLSYHRVSAAIAAGSLDFRKLDGKLNALNCMTKNLAALYGDPPISSDRPLP